jgi:hypothetical protein
MTRLNNEFKSATTPLNSCLVNMYSGPDSYLPNHSDDERCIHPESQIYTLSLGCMRTVKFSEKITELKFEFKPEHCSLYSMTRKSQEFFRHKIDKDPSLTTGDVRVSLTFRSVSWRNHNSTVILGDSNTGGLKFGNASKGQGFGESMPGKRVAAFTVSELDPIEALGYNNIVINCGLNDVRHKSVQSFDQVKDIYIDFKTKVDFICRVNKRAKIFVVPLIPTALPELNRKSMIFNKFLFDDLVLFNRNVSTISGLDEFVDLNGCLKKHLIKDDGLFIHLNGLGIRMLAKFIKQGIFFRKLSSRKGKQVGDRTHGSVTRQPGPW